MDQNNKTSQKTLPPSNIVAEEIIIGHLLLNNTEKQYILESTVSDFFTLQKHQILYDISKTNNTRSISKIINELWRKEVLKKIGGVSHLLYIINKSRAASLHYNHNGHIKYFIDSVRYKYVKRLLIQYSYSVLHLSHLKNTSIQQIHNQASKYLSSVNKSKRVKNKTDIYYDVSSFLNKINQDSKNYAERTSGFRELDKITYGFKEGELIILAGRPSMGKTSLAINIAYHNIFNLKLLVQIFSLEMSKNEILDKLIALASNVSVKKIQQKVIRKHEWLKVQKACRFLIKSSLYIHDQASSSIEYIKEQCKKCFSKKKSSLLTIYN